MKFLLTLFILSTAITSFADVACGSDGPSPFIDISATYQAEAKIVPTNYGVSEFLHWGQKDLIIYRNFKNEVAFTRIGQDPIPFTTSQQPLSRVSDMGERYLALKSEPWVNDTKSGKWLKYSVPATPIVPLFWDADRLYTVNVQSEDGKKHFRIFRYRVGDANAATACNFVVPAGESLEMAQGHAFPEVYFYQVTKKSSDFSITFSTYDVRTCKWINSNLYSRQIPGPAKSVHMFKNLKSILVDIDHPQMTLLWDSTQAGTGYRYYDLKGQTPLVPNHTIPLVVTWSTENGFNLIFPEVKKKAKVDRIIQSVSGPIEDVIENNLWITNDGKRLFLAPIFATDSNRFLVEMKLGSALSN